MRTSVSLGTVARCTALVVLCLCAPLAAPAHARPVTDTGPVVRPTRPAPHALRLPWCILVRGLSNWLVVWV